MHLYELQNFLWIAYNKPQWLARALEILKGREEVYEEDEKRSLRDYEPMQEGFIPDKCNTGV